MHIQQCRKAAVPYVIHDLSVSQVLTQYSVDRGALLRRDGLVFADLVRWISRLFWCEVVGQDIQSQCFECKCMHSMLCSSTGMIASLTMNSSAPVDKLVLFSCAVFVVAHDVVHLHVQQ